MGIFKSITGHPILQAIILFTCQCIGAPRHSIAQTPERPKPISTESLTKQLLNPEYFSDASYDLVEFEIFEEFDGENIKRVELVEYLYDKRLSVPVNTKSLPSTNYPIEHLAQSLIKTHPEVVFDAIKQYANSSDPQLRAITGEKLGQTRDTRAIPLLRTLIEDKEHDVVFQTVRGLTQPMEAVGFGRIPEPLLIEFSNALFEPTLAFLQTHKNLHTSHVSVGALFNMDPIRAADELSKPKYWGKKQYTDGAIAASFLAWEKTMPKGILPAAIRDVLDNPQGERETFDEEHIKDLGSLAISSHDIPPELLNELSSIPNARLQEAFADSAYAAHNIGDPWTIGSQVPDNEDENFDNADQEMMGDLYTLQQKIYYEKEHVSFDGFRPFFRDSESNRWPEQIAALHKIGATDLADIVERAAMSFGPTGPPRDQPTRARSINQLTKKEIRALEMLDSEWEQLKWQLHVFVRDYALAHKESFPIDKQKRLRAKYGNDS